MSQEQFPNKIIVKNKITPKINNFIIGNIKIEEKNLLERIINSFDNVKREQPNERDWDTMNVTSNEKEKFIKIINEAK